MEVTVEVTVEVTDPIKSLKMRSFFYSFVLTQKKQKVKTAEGNHAKKGHDRTLAAVQSYGLSEIARLLVFFAADCRLLSFWERLVKGTKIAIQICFVAVKVTAREVKFALGIAAKSPQRSEDLQRIARPAGERPN